MTVLGKVKRLLHGDPNMEPRNCYAQDGEDLILDRLLDGQQTGFNIDVGAHHPLQFSIPTCSTCAAGAESISMLSPVR